MKSDFFGDVRNSVVIERSLDLLLKRAVCNGGIENAWSCSSEISLGDALSNVAAASRWKPRFARIHQHPGQSSKGLVNGIPGRWHA
jgi:hypothetical protein